MSRSASSRRRLSQAVVLVSLIPFSTAVVASSGSPGWADSSIVAAGPASTGVSASGTQVKAATYAKPPQPTEQQQRLLRTSDRKDGPRGQMAAPFTPVARKPGTSPPGSKTGLATDLTFYRYNVLPAGGLTSPVNEPSTTQSGQNIFATGNWFAGYSHNAGTSWTYLDPFTIFGSGFCCDQLTSYDVGHNTQFWLAQYSDRLVLANSSADNLASWWYYTWTPANFGLPAGASFDYNKMALSSNYLYLATNIYGASGGSLVARFPIDPMTVGAGFGYNWYYRTTEFSPTFIQNAADSMFWGTNWTTDLALGSTFRVLRWDDNSGSATVYDRNIDPFLFMFNGGGNCASADGVVLNWCQRTDSRMTGPGYLAPPAKGTGDAVVGWAFNARQDGAHPFPYIRRISFRASDMTYLGASEFWGSWSAHIYPSLAPDNRGHVGMAFAWGGGTGTAHYYPGSGIMVDDDISPVQPWAYSFYQSGSGNPCLNPDGMRRWGDYLDVHPFYPSGTGWVASGFALNANAGACNTTANVSVVNVAFGRVRDTAAYTRWR
jgi:hypothetical protein